MPALIILHLLLNMLKDSILGFGLTKCCIRTAASAPPDKPCTFLSLPQNNLLDFHSGLHINMQPFFPKRLTKRHVSSGIKQKFSKYTQSWF